VIEINPDEAFLVFEKWHSDGVEILCSSTLFGWGLIFRGRVSAISRDEVSLSSSDGGGTLTLPFGGEDFVFGYAESGEAKLPEGSKDLSGLIVGLPLRLRPSEFVAAVGPPVREKLVFIALPS
jgi:hypothetical protein